MKRVIGYCTARVATRALRHGCVFVKLLDRFRKTGPMMLSDPIPILHEGIDQGVKNVAVHRLVLSHVGRDSPDW